MYVPTHVYGKTASFKYRHPSIRMEYRRAFPRDPPTPSARRAHLMAEADAKKAGPSSPATPTKSPLVYPRRKVQTAHERRRAAYQRSLQSAVVAPELAPQPTPSGPHLPGAFQLSHPTIPDRSPSPPPLKGLKAQEMPTEMGAEARALIKELKALGLDEEDRAMLRRLDKADYDGEIRAWWHKNEVALTEAHEAQPIRDKYNALLKSQGVKYGRTCEEREMEVENVMRTAEEAERRREEERKEEERTRAEREEVERKEAARKKHLGAVDALREQGDLRRQSEKEWRAKERLRAEKARQLREKEERRQQQEKRRRDEEARLRETERLRLFEERRRKMEQERREQEAEKRRLEEEARRREEVERRAQEQREAADRERLRLVAELRKAQQEREEAQRAAADRDALQERLVREERRRAVDELREATAHANAMIAELEREHAATEAYARAAEERAQLIQLQLNAMAAQQWSVVEELRQRLMASYAEQDLLEQAFRQQQASFTHIRTQYEEQQRRAEQEAWIRAQQEAEAAWRRAQEEAKEAERNAAAQAQREQQWGVTLCLEYERRWAMLKSKDSKLVDCVPYSEFPLPVAPLHPYNLDVPWPAAPAPGEITRERVAAFIFSDLRVDVKDKTRKELLKTEMLRWHPDKFEGQMMSKIHPNDKAAMRDAAAAISRILTDIKEQIK